MTAPPPGFPDRPIDIVGYQVIVEEFQVTVPGTARTVTVSPEYVDALGHGEHPFEVLAIDAGGTRRSPRARSCFRSGARWTLKAATTHDFPNAPAGFEYGLELHEGARRRPLGPGPQT